jgi:hypothetical protein
MEETNVIKMETPEVESKKLSYEELENVAKELYTRCADMATELQRMKMDNSFKRLDYLFKVLKYYSLLDTDFVRNCAKEIQEMITIPEEVTDKAE